MLEDDGGTLRSVAWSEICPWLSLFRCFRPAIRLPALILSAGAILLTVGGWMVLGLPFSGNEAEGEVAEASRSAQGCPWLALTDLVPNQPGLPALDAGLPARQSAPSAATPDRPLVDRAPEPFFATWEQLGRPFRQIFRSDTTMAGGLFLLLSGLWSVVVWAFFGGAITRAVAVELACGERVGWNTTMRYAGSRWRDYFLAPFIPLVVVLLAAAVIGLFGLLLRSDVSMLIAAVIWPLLLLGGLVMTLLLLGLAFGWPLMWVTISAEGDDCFDAISRSYQYVFQRPLHYLFYAFVAVLLGIAGWLLVSNVAAGIVALTCWAADWGAGTRSAATLLSSETDIGAVGWFGAAIIFFWCECVKMLAVGFLYSYFWTASTAIYFLLRQSCDATEMDEVFLEEDETEPGYGLPPLETDDAGAPVVTDDTDAPVDQ